MGIKVCKLCKKFMFLRQDIWICEVCDYVPDDANWKPFRRKKKR